MSPCLLKNIATMLEESPIYESPNKEKQREGNKKSLPCEFPVTVLLAKGKNQPKDSMELKEGLVIGLRPSLATSRYNTNLQPS